MILKGFAVDEEVGVVGDVVVAVGWVGTPGSAWRRCWGCGDARFGGWCGLGGDGGTGGVGGW